jgi:hypothetical protein
LFSRKSMRIICTLARREAGGICQMAISRRWSHTVASGKVVRKTFGPRVLRLGDGEKAA